MKILQYIKKNKHLLIINLFWSQVGYSTDFPFSLKVCYCKNGNVFYCPWNIFCYMTAETTYILNLIFWNIFSFSKIKKLYWWQHIFSIYSKQSLARKKKKLLCGISKYHVITSNTIIVPRYHHSSFYKC